MKKLLIIALLCLPMALHAQHQYAYFSQQDVYKSMTDYVEVQRSLTTLREQYAAEMKRAEDEFNTKYEAFLEGQRSFAPSIMRKRQAELRELMEKNIAFKQEAERLLKQAEADMMAPVNKRLHDALQRLGEDNGYALIINTDNAGAAWINPAAATDVTHTLKERLQAK